MSYITRINLYDVRVHPDKHAEVELAIATQKGGRSNFHWMIGCLAIGADGTLVWDDTSEGAWKAHKEFIEDLAAWCSGGYVSFWSREGDRAAWAYEFDGKGGYGECTARRVSALKAAATRRRIAAGGKAEAAE